MNAKRSNIIPGNFGNQPEDSITARELRLWEAELQTLHPDHAISKADVAHAAMATEAKQEKNRKGLTGWHSDRKKKPGRCPE